jgi:SAM-dependent methyltransferase
MAIESLELPNLDEYQDPVLYDLENPPEDGEIDFYASVIRQAGGPVLEVGCGTGRFTIPLAQQGISITGLDVVPAMLERARAKAGDLPITWIEADARSFQLDRQFQVIFETGSVFMHMLTNRDQRLFLACVREHLAPGGRFMFNVFFPHPKSLGTDLEEKDWYAYQDEQGRQVQVSGTNEYDETRQVMVETAIRRITQPGGSVITRAAPLSLRYTFPQEMEALLDTAGFSVVERFGNIDRSPLTNTSPFMLYLCENKLA